MSIQVGNCFPSVKSHNSFFNGSSGIVKGKTGKMMICKY